MRRSSTTTDVPLSEPGFAAIGAELGQLYEALETRDLASGSPTARRLFS
jgi:hypothetical protein